MQPMQLSGNTLTFSNSVEGYSVDFVSPQSYETGPFAIVDGKVINWRCVCGRITVAKPEGSRSIEGARNVYLKIIHPSANRGFDIDVVTGNDAQENTAGYTYVLLYTLDEDGLVTGDFRNSMVFPFYN